MQLPIRDNISFKLLDVKQNSDNSKQTHLLDVKEMNALNDQNNPIISQVVFFARMFENFVDTDIKNYNEETMKIDDINEQKDYTKSENMKDLIYRTYSKSIDNGKALQKNEKKQMKKIMNLLIYLQMKKIELKLNYFNEFEKLIQFENQQIKSMESQIIQDRIKLAIKKCEIMNLSKKVKEIIKKDEANESINHLHKIIDYPTQIKIDSDLKILDLN